MAHKSIVLMRFMVKCIASQGKFRIVGKELHP
jgi:hypothetical protein